MYTEKKVCEVIKGRRISAANIRLCLKKYHYYYYYFKIIVLFISGSGPSKSSKFSEVELAILPLLEKTAICGLQGVQEIEEAMEVATAATGVEMVVIGRDRIRVPTGHGYMVEHPFAEMPIFYELNYTRNAEPV